MALSGTCENSQGLNREVGGMKSLTGKLSSARGWALLLVLFVGAGLFVAACGDEETPAPTTPAPAPPAPPPAPEPEPEPPAVPTGLEISASGLDFVEWRWSAVEGVSGYDVQFSTNEAFTDEDEVIARTAEQISYRRTDLTAETSYYLRVRSAAGTGDGRVTSGWSTHVTGMTTAATPARPPAPTNVRVTGETATTITWSWNAVDGAAGYQVQHSDSATIADDAPTAFASTTTYTVSNLASRTDRHLRVRAYSGTISEPVYGGWSATVEGTTDRAPAPVTTALSAPTGLSTGSLTSSSITVRWNDVDDVDEYEVQQQPADGSWTGASCGGGDARVTDEACVASDLERGTRYSFRVRAHPDPDDDTKLVSGWSSPTAAQTSGQAPREPVAGGDDELNITWESDDDSITWFWNPPSDNRIGHLIALLEGVAKTRANQRPSCPALTDSSTTLAADQGWYPETGSLREFARTIDLSGETNSEGEVRGLCVVRTWKDENDTPQYGVVSVAWATTAPLPVPVATLPSGALRGPRDSAARKTTALDWWIEKDEGFEYDIRFAKATIDTTGSDRGSCADVGSGGTTLPSVNKDDEPERYRLANPDAYTEYQACVQARSATGASAWTNLTAEYTTLPIAPPAPQYRSSDSTLAVSGSSSTLTWRIAANDNQPTAAGDYDVEVYFKTEPWATTVSVRPNQCGTGTAPTGYTAATGTPSIVDDGSEFRLQLSQTVTNVDNSATTTPDESTQNQTHTVVTCLRSKLGSAFLSGRTAGTNDGGPWSVSSTSVVIKPSS